MKICESELRCLIIGHACMENVKQAAPHRRVVLCMVTSSKRIFQSTMNLETSDVIMINKIFWSLRKGKLKKNYIMHEWRVSVQLQLHWQVPFRSELRMPFQSKSKSIICRITTQLLLLEL